MYFLFSGNGTPLITQEKYWKVGIDLADGMRNTLQILEMSNGSQLLSVSHENIAIPSEAQILFNDLSTRPL